MQTIGCFNLTNEGGFVCAGEISYIDSNGNSGKTDRYGYINLGQSELMLPSDKGVQADWIIQLYIDINGGNDRTGGTHFLYDPNSTACAHYRITGTTLNSEVHFDGITPTADVKILVTPVERSPRKTATG
ncbi:hypothetical protein COCOR_06208 [Corallococcus coralloides DSM 2259]|uniref:Lipoprotein n=1 Tax=Corallococcus coralloides (strain ATCC 25202 / DSM 2259 / NBRC 100086 / M2) TaxID=1144275 RepID=H8MNS7_CORCM|nr:hypothetical protein [Corallococcus coralloides]AFE06808.1 hypothetical protein COCOR_06208 [Corallococcus coralloides DSM 2259]